jgi:hypothetical protein
MGHEDQFRRPGLSGGCPLGKETFAGMGGKDEDAPKPVIPRSVNGLQGSPQSSR